MKNGSRTTKFHGYLLQHRRCVSLLAQATRSPEGVTRGLGKLKSIARPERAAQKFVLIFCALLPFMPSLAFKYLEMHIYD